MQQTKRKTTPGVKDAGSLNEKGIDKATNGDFHDAYRSFKKAGKENPDSESIAYNQCLTFYKINIKQNPQLVLTKIRIKLETFGDSIRLRNLEALTLAELGKHEEALQSIAQVKTIPVADVPTPPAVRNAPTLAKVEKKDEAREAMKAILNTKAMLLNYLGKPLEAIKVYDKALPSGDEDPEIILNKANALAQNGDYKDAIGILEELSEKLKKTKTTGEDSMYDIVEHNLAILTMENEKRNSLLYKLNPAAEQVSNKPTHIEFAYCAEDSYKDFDFAPKGLESWEKLPVKLCPDCPSGYFGAAYYCTTKNALIIGHRGTSVKDIQDLEADVYLAKGELPAQLKDAEIFVETVLKFLAEKNVKPSFVGQAGHSLGAALAELVVWSRPNDIAVTFDSPGIIEVIEMTREDNDLRSLDSIHSRVTCYLSTPNLVNTMGRHVGTLLRIVPMIERPKISFWSRTTDYLVSHGSKMIFKSTTFPGFLMGLATETLATHSMTAIRDCLIRTKQPERLCNVVLEWPLGPLNFAKYRSFVEKYRNSILRHDEDNALSPKQRRELKIIGYSTKNSVTGQNDDDLFISKDSLHSSDSNSTTSLSSEYSSSQYSSRIFSVLDHG